MWRSRTPVSSLPLFCAFLCCCDRSPLPALGHSELRPPENLSIVSHDFHTVLTWDVPATSRSSLFNVEILDYKFGKWKPFMPCSNISKHQCDLSEVFIPVKYGNGYCAKVNAVARSQKSNFSHTYRFTFGNNATLGPPTVHLTANNDELTVELNYTVFPSPKNKTQKILKKLSYNIYLRNVETSEITKECENQDPVITIKVPVGIICVSAEVHIDILKLKGERSQETCLQIQLNDSSVLAFKISGGILAAIFMGLLATVLVCYFVKKKQALPKVLAQHVMGGKRYSNISSMKPEESNVSVLTTLETVPNVCEADQEDETQVEMIKDSSDLIDADPVTVDADDREPVNPDLKDPYAAKIDVSGTDQTNVSEDNIQEGNGDLKKTDDLCKTNSDFEKQICANNWGYDKPQVLLILNN